MKIGAFEIDEPVPKLEQPHALAMLRPWVDAGSVGSLTLARLERHFKAKKLGELARPGNFFDFTRYRPTMGMVEGRREINVPNTYLRYAQRTDGQDFLFLHMLEPHMFAEDYMDSIIEVLKVFEVKNMVRIGSMYDALPHTRPLLVSGTAAGTGLQGVQTSTYQGPTSIAFQISERAPELGLEVASLMVRLPQYVELEEDFSGVARAMEVLRSIYDLPDYLVDSKRGQAQYQEVSRRVAGDPKLRAIIERLEAMYDQQAGGEPTQDSPADLSPEVEDFLRKMDERFEGDGS